MRTVSKQITSGGNELGTLDFPIYDNLGEIVDAFGEDATYKLAQRALTIDVERIARDNLKQGKDEKEAQALVDGYKPGGSRSAKPTLKNLMARMQSLGQKAKDDEEAMDDFLEVGKVYNTEGVEAAIAFLDEKGY
jgi:hypothetical protein